MKIAIIGSSSFLGTALFDQFRTSKHKWYLFNRKRPVELPEGCTWLPYNAPALPLSMFQLSTCDVIYFCAGAGIQPKHDHSDALIYELNTFEPIRLVTELQKVGFSGKLVTFGSYFEIGNQVEEHAYTEQAIATHQNPLPNAYCRSKNLLTRFADNHLLAPNALSFCWQHFILTNIYGAGENHQRLFPYIIQSVAQNQSMEFTSGIQQRQYTHVNDVARFLQQTLSSQQSGLFNLTAPTVSSVRSVIETVLELAEEHFGHLPAVSFGSISKRDERMKYLALDMTLTQNCFTFEANTPLKDGIRAYFTLSSS